MPIVSGLFVPWIAYLPPERVRARAPMGLLRAPPGILSGTSGLSRLISAVGDQAGSTKVPSISAWPCHCFPALPQPGKLIR